MELLLALLGVAGIAILVNQQSKILPSEDEYNKALDKWAKDTSDKDAKLVIGKYLAFVKGDYRGGMPFLSTSSDPVLSALGDLEIVPENHDTPQKKMALGDQWAVAARKTPALSRIFYDRAYYWYITAWPDLDAVGKKKARDQGRRLAASRPPGAARTGAPSGWRSTVGNAGRPSVIDGNVAHTGSYSVRIQPADEKVPGSGSAFASDIFPAEPGKKFVAFVHVLADGTENANDRVFMYWYNAKLEIIGNQPVFIPADVPFWSPIVLTGEVPQGAARAHLEVALLSKKGSMWIDDASVKVDGKEMLKNLSFEER